MAVSSVVDWNETNPDVTGQENLSPEAVQMLSGILSAETLFPLESLMTMIENSNLQKMIRKFVCMLIFAINVLVKRLSDVLSGVFEKEEYVKLDQENKQLAQELDAARNLIAQEEKRNAELKMENEQLWSKGAGLTEIFLHHLEIQKRLETEKYQTARESHHRLQPDCENDPDNDAPVEFEIDEMEEDFPAAAEYKKLLFVNQDKESNEDEDQSDGDQGAEDGLEGTDKGDEASQNGSDCQQKSSDTKDTSKKKTQTKAGQQKTKKTKKTAKKAGSPAEQDQATDDANTNSPGNKKVRTKRSENTKKDDLETEQPMADHTASDEADGKSGNRQKKREYKTRVPGDQQAVINNVQVHKYQVCLPNGEIITQDTPFTEEDIRRQLRVHAFPHDVKTIKMHENASVIERIEYLQVIHSISLEIACYDNTEATKENVQEMNEETAQETAKTVKEAVEETTVPLSEDNSDPMTEEQPAQETEKASEVPESAQMDNDLSSHEEQNTEKDCGGEKKGTKGSKGGCGKSRKGKKKDKGSKKAAKARHKKHVQQREAKRCRRKIIHIKTSVGGIFHRNSHLTPSLLAWVLALHFSLCVSVYRILSQIWQKGVGVSEATIYNWMSIGAQDLRPLADYMFAIFKQTNTYAHADESPGIVLQEPGRDNQTKSYFWFYVTVDWAEHQICIMRYHPGRKGEFAADDLQGFAGKLITDAYAAYNCVQEIIRCMCNSHSRRYFFYAAKFGCTARRRRKAREIVELYDILFALERSFKAQGFSAAQILEARKKQSKPIFDQIVRLSEEIINDKQYANSQLYRAAAYAYNNREALGQFLNDGLVPLSNNRCERMVKPFALLRSNSLLFASPNGATNAAICFSVIKTAELNGLDPQSYLEYVFQRISETSKELRNTKEFLDTILPWAEGPQKNCARIVRTKMDHDETFRKVA